MSSDFKHWWRYLEFPTKFWLVVITLLLTLLSLPYLVGYVLPFLALSIFLGVAFRRGCYVSETQRSYGRVALFIPLTLLLGLAVLRWMAPRTERPPVASKGTQSISVVTPRDPYTEEFNALYLAWYRGIPFIGPMAQSTYDFETVRRIVLAAIVLGGPWAFWSLYGKDAEEAERALHHKLENEYNQRERKREARIQEVEKLERDMIRWRDSVQVALKAQVAEIERLKKRERYHAIADASSSTLPSKAPNLDDL